MFRESDAEESRQRENLVAAKITDAKIQKLALSDMMRETSIYMGHRAKKNDRCMRTRTRTRTPAHTHTDPCTDSHTHTLACLLVIVSYTSAGSLLTERFVRVSLCCYGTQSGGIATLWQCPHI